jgi:hypothetical protein
MHVRDVMKHSFVTRPNSDDLALEAAGVQTDKHGYDRLRSGPEKDTASLPDASLIILIIPETQL